MTELSTAQRTILTSAAKSPDTEIRQFMQHIKSPAIQDKMITALLRKKMLTVQGAEAVGNHYKFDKNTKFVISQEGLNVINGSAEGAPVTPCNTEKHDVTPSNEPKRETKQSVIINLLSREEGTTLTELIDATGWKPHSVRGHLSNLRKKRGLPIETFTTGEGKHGYRLLPDQEAA
jgi:hypothetical protein